MTAPRVALVHERFTEYGGSEAVVAEFIKTWPDASVFAPIVSPEGYRALAAAVGPERRALASMRDSWLSRAHAALGGRSHAPLLPFVPRTLRRLPLADGYDARIRRRPGRYRRSGPPPARRRPDPLRPDRYPHSRRNVRPKVFRACIHDVVARTTGGGRSDHSLQRIT